MTQYNKNISVLLLSLVLALTSSAQTLWLSGRQDYTPLWASIKSGKPIKVLHIGDSHINRGYTSRPIEQALRAKYGANVAFAYNGINGSTYASWTNESNLRQIQEQAPDLLIVSLGTNDSYTHNFSAESFRASMDLFLDKVQALLPDVKIILTTPPACYLRSSRSRVVGYKGKGRRRKAIYSSSTSYNFNSNTRIAVNTIKYFGKAEGLPVIDLNAVIGTKAQCEEWLRNGLMHSDHVHYTELGYARQGEAIAKALVEAIGAKK